MKVKREDLFNSAVALLTAAGESPEGAALVAETFCKADARGITTHGSYLLNPIFNRVRAGQLTLPTAATVAVDTAAVAVVDGGDGLGPVAGKLAADLAVARAKQYGIGLVLIRNTNSVGSLAYYTEMVARQGMIALMSSNAAPSMAPWGGAEAFTGTNPIAIAIYTGRELLFSADMATSVVARGKIRQAARRGKEIPPDWALDSSGNQTTDPNEALKGTLLPMGGPKGSAIALAVDILSGIVAGAEHAPNIKSFHNLDGKTGVGASLIAIDIEKFMALDAFKASMDEYIASLKNMKKASFANEIYLPGEIEYNKERESLVSGISLDDEAVAALNQLLESVGSDLRLTAMD
ncbi:MAG: Ldh family oxidoreductase [Chloroflexi bacterium]|jgi:LDH2 family malate/lactate/ureidoglycolate dehydrogenase|nr:Ldh family oxidoreductase [Anaerolineaceae bacterium]NLI45009.1 Ldh family oxidoreductase [Chloroflexota bacterium]HOE35121.1 Ldh family oxidoreductase [Anaerolineaceae bacterium]HQK03126.1 Ldh family oxidoreductase [Anaerolineaceae bacterium]